jgi:hypothetical protein
MALRPVLPSLALALAAGCAATGPRAMIAEKTAELRACNDWHTIVRLRLDNRDPFRVPVGSCTRIRVEPGEHVLSPEPHLLPGDWFVADAWVVNVPASGTSVRFGGDAMLDLVRVEAPAGGTFERCEWRSGRLKPGTRIPYKTTYYAPSNITPDISREQVLRWVRAATVCERRSS